MLNLCGRWCRRRPNAAPGTAEAGEVEMDMVVRFDDQIKGKHVKLGSEGDTILSSGTVHVGVTSNIITELDLPLSSRSSSWFKNISNIAIDEIIGISYDLSSVRPLLRIFVKGKEIASIRTAPGDVFAAVSVQDGAHIKANFGRTPFLHCPDGFTAITSSVSLL